MYEPGKLSWGEFTPQNFFPDADLATSLMQLDGNLSFNSSFDSLPPEPSQCIPVHHGFRPPRKINDRWPPVRLSCNSSRSATFIPTITLYNARSLFPKISSLITDMQERKVAAYIKKFHLLTP